MGRAVLDHHVHFMVGMTQLTAQERLLAEAIERALRDGALTLLKGTQTKPGMVASAILAKWIMSQTNFMDRLRKGELH